MEDKEEVVINTDDVTGAARRGLWAMASSSVLQQLVTWGLTLVTIRLLTPEDYGLMSLVESFAPYFAVAASFDLSSWVVQRQSLGKDEERAAFTLGTTLGTISFLFAVLVAPVLSWFYGNNDILLPFILVGFTFFLRGFGSFGEGKLKREMRFAAIAKVQLVIAIARGITQVILAWQGYGFWSLIFGLVLAEGIRNLVWFFLADASIQLNFDKKVFREALKFGLPSAGASLLWILYSGADNLFVGKFFGPDMLGLYAMAYYLVDLPASRINQIIRPILLPYYSRLKHDSNKLKEGFLNTVTGTTALLFPCTAGIGIIANDFVPLVLGDSWKGLETPIIVMSLSGILRVSMENMYPLFLSLGQTKYSFYCNCFSAIVFPALVISLGLSYGLPGVYASWFVFLPLAIAVSLHFMHRASGISPRDIFGAMLKPAFSALLMMSFGYTLSYYFLDNSVPWLSLILVIVGSAALYGLSLRVLLGRRFIKICLSAGIGGREI
ncbi:MAG: lipopolysaccharide biosynthesis protein [bacterium]|nr:lipopolysaccharide biosynthesis protein [bacterium]